MKKLLVFATVLVMVLLLVIGGEQALADDPPDDKGLAISDFIPTDIDLLGSDWWYVYGNNPSPTNLGDDRYVPMLQFGNTASNLPADYDGHILVFNEPDLPGQAVYTPQQAYDKFQVLKSHYVNATFVFGNISHLGLSWIEEYMVLCDTDCPELWGIHCYPWNEWQFCADFLPTVHDVIGTDMWLTETQATIDGDPALLVEIINWTKETSWVPRYAVFGNRDMSGEYWWPEDWGDVALVDDNGELTYLGRIYRDEAFKIFMPIFMVGDGFLW
jgi:hypothetical protein